MSLFGQLRHPITVNDTAGSRVYTIWESCKSSPDLRAHKRLQNCFKLFVNNGPNSSLGTEWLSAIGFKELHRLTPRLHWVGGYMGPGTGVVQGEFEDDTLHAHSAKHKLMRGGNCTNICPKTTGVNASRGREQILCIFTPLWDTYLVQSIDEPNAKIAEQGVIHRLINEGGCEGIEELDYANIGGLSIHWMPTYSHAGSSWCLPCSLVDSYEADVV